MKLKKLLRSKGGWIGAVVGYGLPFILWGGFPWINITPILIIIGFLIGYFIETKLLKRK